MDSAKRLEQAIEKLEQIMKNNPNNSSFDNNSELATENELLRKKQEQVKLKLDKLIIKASAS